MPATSSREDWAGHLERLAENDRRSLFKLTRLINGFLGRWNAYDFREDWEDLIQEVLVAAVRAQSEGKIRERAHTYGFIKTVTRNKFVDRLKQHLRSPADRSLPWEEVVENEASASAAPMEPTASRELQEALGRLEEKRRQAVLAVHLEGQTHDEASKTTGIPVGSLRRYLREGLQELKTALSTSESGKAPPPAKYHEHM